MADRPKPTESPFRPVKMQTRTDPPGLGLVLGVAVVLFALVLLLVFSLAWFR